MLQPDFWYRSKNSIIPYLLWPAGQAYLLACKIRRNYSKTWRASVPVICVGNLVVGGAGKTPTAIAIGKFFKKKGLNIHFLSRGYGKRLIGPIRVNPAGHSANDVGDEPLLLAQIAPTWVSADRRAAAELAIKTGAKILVMDDGFQNPEIHKDVSILVVDGEVGFGNGQLIPAGPLREGVNRGVSRANAVLIIGDDEHGLNTTLKSQPNMDIKILRGQLLPEQAVLNLKQKKVFAFSGIGRPKKFFNTLKAMGCSISGTAEFNDHHIYTTKEINSLVQEASDMNAILVTTSKDRVRLDEAGASKVLEIPVSLNWEDCAELEFLFKPVLADLS